MTRDDIIRLAREAGVLSGYESDLFQRFATLVAAAEREACAKLCENGPLPKDPTPFTHIPTLVRCAAAIRSRGESK